MSIDNDRDPPMDARPTPPSGMPAAMAAAESSTPDLGSEILAPKSERSVAILAGITALRIEQRDMRNELRAQRIDTRDRFDKIEKKVDALSNEDESLRLEFRRLEQRQIASDEDHRILREDVRRLREEGDQDKVAMGDTLAAMQRHFELNANANAKAVRAAVSGLDSAAERFTAEAERVANKDGAQDQRLDKMELFASSVCEELGIDAPEGILKTPSSGEKKQGRLTLIANEANEVTRRTIGNRKVTWAAVALAAIQLAYFIARIFFPDKLPSIH